MRNWIVRMINNANEERTDSHEEKLILFKCQILFSSDDNCQENKIVYDACFGALFGLFALLEPKLWEIEQKSV